MATRTELSLPHAQVERIERDGDIVRIHLSEFFSYVSLSGSSERTQWRQAGILVLDDAQVEDGLPDGPVALAGGDVHDNTYTYRDLVPLPLDARGRVGCTLRIEGRDEALVLQCTRLRLETLGERRYVAHVRDQ